MPLTQGATRRSILAALSPSDRAGVLEALGKAEQGLDHDFLADECRRIAAQGFAVSTGEVTPHTVGIAVPLRHNEVVVGSMAIAGPEHRMSEDVIQRSSGLLQTAAQTLADQWRDVPPPALAAASPPLGADIFAD